LDGRGVCVDCGARVGGGGYMNIDDTISLKEVVEKMKKEIGSPGPNC